MTQHGTEPEARGRAPLVAFLAFISFWLGGSWLVVGSLIRPWLPGGWWTVATILTFGVVPIFLLARGLSGDFYPSAAIRLLILRPFWYAVLFLPLLAGAGVLGGVVGLPFGAGGATGRGTVAAASVLLALASIAGYAGSRRLVVRRLEVRSPHLPEAFEGLRIVQLSDLHVGPQTAPAFLARVAAATQESRPDLVVITGDQVDDFAQDVALFTRAFGGLSAPLGVFAVAGNHDVYAGWSAVRQGLSTSGIQVMVNEAVPLVREESRIWLAGIGDPSGETWCRDGGRSAAPDIEKTLRDIPPGEWTLALAHNPALWPALEERRTQLTLSGHTHYGQLAIPRWKWCAASPFLRLAMGVHRSGDSLLYIQPGTNYWGIPLRLGTPPEVTLLTLRCGGRDEVPSITAATRRVVRE